MKSDDWQDTVLGEVVGLQRGHDLPKRKRRPGHVPVIGSGGITGHHDEAISDGPGVIIGRATNLGRPVWSAGAYWPLNTSLYVTDFKGNDPRYVFHLFEVMDLSGFDSGSVQPMLNRNYVQKVPVFLPPLSVQRAIAGVLGALDDLIDTNQKLAERCGQLWRAMLQSVEERELLPLSGLADFVNGLNFTKGADGHGRPVIRTPEARSGPVANTVWNAVEADADRVANRGDILFVWSGSLMVVRWAWQEGLVNQHLFKVLPKEEVPSWLVLAAIEFQLDWFLGLAADKATTMGHIKRADLDALASVPAQASWKRLGAAIGPLYEAELAYRVECQSLHRTRDELLPLLLSGRVLPGEVSGL